MVKKYNELYENLKKNDYKMSDLIYHSLYNRALSVLITLIYEDIIKKEQFQEIVDDFTDLLFTENGDDQPDLDKVYDLLEVMIHKGLDVNMVRNDSDTILELVVSIEDDQRDIRNSLIDLIMNNGMVITNPIGDYIENVGYLAPESYKYIEEKYPKKLEEYKKYKQTKKFKI